ASGHEKEQDAANVRQGRQHPAYQDDLLVVVFVQHRTGRLQEKDRQRAVDEVSEVSVIRIERRMRAVEVQLQIEWPLQRLVHHNDKSLVRMEMLAAVPIDVEEPQGAGSEEDAQKGDDQRPALELDAANGQVVCCTWPVELVGPALGGRLRGRGVVVAALAVA